MPFALVFIGLLMIVSGVRDTYKEFGAALIEDFSGDRNFFYWVIAVLAVGSIGYYPKAQGLSRAFLGLVIIAMVVSNRGVFANLTRALETGPVNPRQDTANDRVETAAAPVGPLGIVPGDAAGNFGKVVNTIATIAKAFI